VEKSTRLDRLDRLVHDFSVNSTWPIFHRLDRFHRSTTGVYRTVTITIITNCTRFTKPRYIIVEKQILQRLQHVDF